MLTTYNCTPDRLQTNVGLTKMSLIALSSDVTLRTSVQHQATHNNVTVYFHRLFCPRFSYLNACIRINISTTSSQTDELADIKQHQYAT